MNTEEFRTLLILSYGKECLSNIHQKFNTSKEYTYPYICSVVDSLDRKGLLKKSQRGKETIYELNKLGYQVMNEEMKTR